MKCFVVYQLLFILTAGIEPVSEGQNNGLLEEIIQNGDEKQRSKQHGKNELYPVNGATHLQSDINKQACSETNAWFVWNNKTRSCDCGDDLDGMVQCSAATKELSVLDCHCLTVHHTTQGTQLALAGSCIFNCVRSTGLVNIMYHSAPTDCASLNRQGTLCGQCLDGYTVPAYSYEFKCIRCDSELENWGLYIVFAFVPLTVFIVIILVFRINVLSPKLNMFVFAAQSVSIPIFIRIIFFSLSLRVENFMQVPTIVIVTAYGIWNLDFFRVNVLPDVCINVIPLHVLVLDYLIAIYPMLLMAVAYTIVELYGFGFRPLLYMWKPFHFFFARFRRQWGIQTTIMDAFVTFFFLSTTKLLSVSCDLLLSTRLFTSDGKLYSQSLYYDPSIEYFGKEHLPYALLAIGILTVFIAFPTSLLLFYQCKLFCICLRKCRIKGTILDKFVYIFQKYYKDGSNGTWDCRWFAGFFIIIKSLAYFAYSVALNVTSFIFIVILCISAAAVIVIVEPYKEEYKQFNVISANLFLWEALLFTSALYTNQVHILQSRLDDHFVSAAILSLFPLVYIIVVIIHHLIRRFRGEKGGDELTSSLPHRLLHSDQYRDNFGYIAASPRH